METAMWTRRRIGAVMALALGVSSIAAPHGVGAQTPASALVLGTPVITIAYPATDEEAYQAADMALGAAGVQYVLEGSVRPPDQPAFDFARPPETHVPLTGLSLTRALSEIARADPAFHYTLSGNVVVARFGAGSTPLDTPLTQFNLTAADPSDVLKAIISSIDPHGIDAHGIDGWRFLTRPAKPDAPTAPPVDVHRAAGTVRDALVAIAASAPGRSLRASYVRSGGELVVSGLDIRDGAVLTSTFMAMASAPTATPDGTRVLLSVGGFDLSSILMSYARQSGVPIGVEMLPFGADGPRPGGQARVDVTGLPPAEALKRIVAYDSRYQITAQDGGWFLVAPKVGIPGRPAILDTPLPPFVRHGESIDVVGSDLVARLGARYSSPTGSGGSPAPSPALSPEERLAVSRQMLAAAGARTVSVEFPRETTGRAVLQAMAVSAEAYAWLLRGTSSANGQVSYQYTLQFPDGTSVGRSFSIDSGVPPSRPTPAPLRTLDANTVGVAVREIARDTHAAVTSELTQAAGSQPQRMTDPQFLSRLRGLGVETALTQLMAVCAECSWKKDHDIYRITSTHTPTHDAWLDRKVDSFRHHFANIREAFNEVRKLGAPTTFSMGVGGTGAAMPEERSFDVNLGRSTIRQVLDAIATASGSNTWSVTYTDANGTFPEVALQLTSAEGHGITGSIPIR